MYLITNESSETSCLGTCIAIRIHRITFLIAVPWSVAQTHLPDLSATLQLFAGIARKIGYLFKCVKRYTVFVGAIDRLTGIQPISLVLCNSKIVIVYLFGRMDLQTNISNTSCKCHN